MSFKGTFLGFVFGVATGLGIAAGAAYYITKAPVPFLDKVANQAAQTVKKIEKELPKDPNAQFSKGAAPVDVDPIRQALAQADSQPQAPAPKVADKTAPKAAEKPAPKAAEKPAPKAAEPAAKPKAERYVIQVGSRFKNARDAEPLRGQLAMIGLDSSVVRKDSGYVVRTGPYPSVEKARRARRSIQAERLASEIIKLD